MLTPEHYEYSYWYMYINETTPNNAIRTITVPTLTESCFVSWGDNTILSRALTSSPLFSITILLLWVRLNFVFWYSCGFRNVFYRHNAYVDMCKKTHWGIKIFKFIPHWGNFLGKFIPHWGIVCIFFEGIKTTKHDSTVRAHKRKKQRIIQEKR